MKTCGVISGTMHIPKQMISLTMTMWVIMCGLLTQLGTQLSHRLLFNQLHSEFYGLFSDVNCQKH